MKITEKLIVSFLIITVVIGIYFFYTNKDFYAYLVQEDGFFENLTSIFLFLSSFYLFYFFISNIKLKSIWWKMGIIIMIIGLFFGAGEEISWGQRIFHIESSKFFNENNSQKETNLHNMIVDGVKLMSSPPIITTFESELFLGNVIVCGNQPEFISYNSDTDAISGIVLGDIAYGKKENEANLQGFGRDSTFINIIFELPIGVSTLPVGSYPIVDGSLIALSEQFNWARFPILESGTINITTPGVNPGDEINGNYSVKMKKEQGIEIYEFKGDFRVKL